MTEFSQTFFPEIPHILRKAGLRRTKDRQMLLALLYEKRTWTPQQLLYELSQTDKSTIYRNIQLFLDANIIKPVHIHDGETHYEMQGRDHHDHLHCTTCHAFECIPCPVPSIKTHSLEIHGTCSLC